MLHNSELENKKVKKRSFAFFIHPTDDIDSISGLKISFPALSDDKLNSILSWSRTFTEYRMNAEEVFHIESIKSEAGCEVEGWLVFSTFSAKEMLRMKKNDKERLLDSYFNVAKDLGVDYIGLGAFTSILSRGGTYFENKGIAVTTGNSYTAMSSIYAVEELLIKKGEYAADKSIAVVGAYGSIGRIVSLYSCHAYKSIKLIGNLANSNSLILLERLADELIQECIGSIEAIAGTIAQSVISVLAEKITNKKSISYAIYESGCKELGVSPVIEVISLPEYSIATDLVYCATSNAGAFLTIKQLENVEVVCDISRPTDIDSRMLINSGIEYVEGGLSYLPEDIMFGKENLQGFPSGINLGCLSETIALTMEGDGKNYSVGSFVSLEEAKQVYAVCQSHGFRPYLKIYNEDKNYV